MRGRAGIDAPHSCREGVCGSCETRVISGVPDHHLSAFLKSNVRQFREDVAGP